MCYTFNVFFSTCDKTVFIGRQNLVIALQKKKEAKQKVEFCVNLTCTFRVMLVL